MEENYPCSISIPIFQLVHPLLSPCRCHSLFCSKFRIPSGFLARFRIIHEESDDDSHLEHDFFSMLSKPKDYYKILEVDYDAPEEKWHPDKKKNEDSATSRFQEINEAYQVLIDPVKRRECDKKGMLYAYDSNITEILQPHNAADFFYKLQA